MVDTATMPQLPTSGGDGASPSTLTPDHQTHASPQTVATTKISAESFVRAAGDNKLDVLERALAEGMNVNAVGLVRMRSGLGATNKGPIY
eukprot:9495403-Pyramimonas_sp.AAC.1